jgi:type I restriction enzyme M protein
VRKNNFVLTPGRYIDFKEEGDDGEVFEGKMKKLTSDLKEQMDKGSELDTLIKENLNTLGYEI